MRCKLLLATNNPGKVHEYQSLLRGIAYELVTPAEAGIKVEVNEVGESLEANARLKATAFAERGQMLSLADDSGLEVDALGGEPGRFSARYAGEGATDADRVIYLLSRLEGVPREQRTARFRCVIAIAAPGGEVQICSGECQGIIALAPKGKQGFGYDPVFYFPEFDKTMAELPLRLKNQISHRAEAARKACKVLQELSARQKCV